MEENYSKSDASTEKQVFLSESEELSKEDTPADFDISIEELTAKLAEKKPNIKNHRGEEKVVIEVKEEIKSTSELKPIAVKIEAEESIVKESPVKEPPKQFKPVFTPQQNFFQSHRWLIIFTILLVFSYFWFHPTENNLVNSAAISQNSVVDNTIKETVKEIPQTPAVEKIDLRGERLRKLIVEGVKG